MRYRATVASVVSFFAPSSLVPRSFVMDSLRDTSKMLEYFKKRIIKYFVENDYLTKDQGKNLLSRKNSGFSIDNSVLILGFDTKTREAPGQ